jgi:hypothetical protein
MNNKFLIAYIIITILTVIAFTLLIYFNVFRRKQQGKTKSLATGFGFYSDPIEGPCITPSGSCGEAGTQRIIKKCIVNPTTGKGCIGTNGTMVYDDLIITNGCAKQCVGSAFEVSNGLQYKKLYDSNDNEYILPTSSGVNKIFNNYGIDFTDEFLGDFNPLTNSYNFNKCFNSDDYISYSTITYNCINYDTKGSNNCQFICGVDNAGAITPLLVNDINLNIKVPKYPMIGNRYICLDQFGNNQIEAFNTGNIPNEFVYPDICYQNYIKNEEIIKLELTANITLEQKYITVLNTNLTPYDLLNNYNFYYPLKIGYETTILEKIININNYININNTLPFIYLDFGIDLTNKNLTINGDSLIYTPNSNLINDQYNILDDNILILSLDYLSIYDNLSLYYYDSSTNQIQLTYNSSDVNINSYVYYSINNDNVINQNNISKISGICVANSYFTIDAGDLGPDAYLNGIKYNILDNDKIYNNVNPLNITIQNRLDNNKYFLSPTILPTPFFGVSGTVRVINKEVIEDKTNDIFYIFDGRFFYPMSLNNSPNSINFNFPQYGDTDFYLLENGVSYSILPPNQNLNFQSFEDVLSYSEARVINGNYGNYLNYIKQLIFVSNGTSNYNDNTFYIYNSDYNNYYQYYNATIESGNGNVIKKVDGILSSINSQIDNPTNAFTEKMKLYNTININNSNFENIYGNNFNIIISPSIAVVKILDYTKFRSPIITASTSDNIGNKICFDQYNKPLPVGTKVLLNNEDVLEWYKKGNLKNNCGTYKPNTQTRNSNIPTIGSSILINRDNLNYYNYLDFYDNGYEIENLYCYQTLNGPSVNIENCRKPYITNIYNLDNYYNVNEDLYMDFLNTNLYYSTIDNNTSSPNDANNWLSTNLYNNREFINSGSQVYSDYNNYLFNYEVINEGMTGEELAKIGVYYLYNKNNPIFEYRAISNAGFDYIINTNYYQNNWYNEQFSNLGLQVGSICQQYNYQYLYDIELSYTNNLSNNNFYTFEIGIATKNNFEVGDYFNPDFNLFNSIIINSGISVFNFGYANGTDNMIEGTSIFNNVNLTGASIGNLICIGYDPNDNIYVNYSNPDNIYNYSFEVCQITNIIDNNVVVNRNLLNYPIENRYSGNGLNYVAYLLDSDLDLKLLFPITKVFNNIIYFNFNAYSLSTPNVNNIINNCQSRTAISARIIKKNISIPNNNISSIPGQLYLMKSPNINKVSAYVDLILKQNIGGGLYNYYINEYNLNIYLDNQINGIFNLGDSITLDFPNNSYNLPILGKNIFYQNILFNYISTTNVNIVEISSRYYNINYIIPTAPQNYSNLIESLNIINTINITVDTNNVLSNINPNTYTNQYFQSLPSQISYQYSINYFQSLMTNQINLDTANNLVKMSLNSTRIYPDLENLNSYLILNNILLNEKPYGPSYLIDLTNSNNLNFDGYGTITSFDISQNLLNNRVSTGQIFESISGFVFSVASNVSSYQFNTLLRKSNLTTYTNSDNITNNLTISKPILYNNQNFNSGDLVQFNNINKLLYTNTNNNISKFNSEGNALYDQQYCVLSNNLYYYPLYLYNSNNRTLRTFSEYPSINFYSDSDYTNNIIRPNNNIYKLFSSNDLQSSTVWRQVAQSIYPVNNLTNYNSQNNYLSGDIVIYQNKAWIANNDNINTLNLNQNTSGNWSLYNNYNSNLYNTNGYFFNINMGSSLVGVSLYNANYQDINNYPISLIDYSSNINYTLYLGAKGINNYNFNNSFLDNFSNIQTDLLGKALIFKDQNGIVSLASNPTSTIEDYSFLKENNLNFIGNPYSQYIYNIALPDNEVMGRPFCVGNVPYPSSEVVSNYEFSNSITFVPIPVDLQYQNYPFIIYNGTSINSLPINSIFNYQGVSTINAIVQSTNGDINYLPISFKKSFYINISSEQNFDVTWGFINLLPANLSGDIIYLTNVLNVSGEFYNNDYWYANDNNDNLIAYGNIIYDSYGPNNTLTQNNINILYYSNNIEQNTNYNFNINNTTFDIRFYQAYNEINIDEPLNIDGVYTFESYNNQVDYYSMYLVFNNNSVLNFNQIYIETPLSLGDKVYFPPPGNNDLKIKMYGFFGKEYLSPIVYQTTKLIISDTGVCIPNLVFAPYSNQILNPIKDDYQIIDSLNNQVVILNYKNENVNDVFNLGSSLSLKTNPLRYPLYNLDGSINNNNVLNINAINIPLGIINTDSVTNLISTTFDFSNNIILGSIDDVFPTDTNNDNNMYYAQTKGALNLNTNTYLECSIYQYENTFQYPNGQFLNLYISNNNTLLNLTGVSNNVKTTNVGINYFNTTTFLDQSDISNNSLPIYIGISGGISFKNSIIENILDIGTSSSIQINYYLNGGNVSYSYYHNLGNFNDFNKYSNRTINIVCIKNNYFDNLPNQVLYLGTSNPISGLIPFSDGITNLTFINNNN